MKIRITIIENNVVLPGEHKQQKVIIYYLDLSRYSLAKEYKINSDGSLELINVELIGLTNNEVIIFPVNSFFNFTELQMILAYYDKEYPELSQSSSANFWDVNKRNQNENN